MYKDRFEAGERLAEKIKQYKKSNTVILAIPKGGVEIGYILAKETGLPLDVCLIKKVRHPINSELIVCSVSLHSRVINKKVLLPYEYIEEATIRARIILQKKSEEMQRRRVPVSLEGKTVIITDDCISSGSTMTAAIEMVRENNPHKIIVASPVVSPEVIERIEYLADEVIFDFVPEKFYRMNQFYSSLDHVDDSKVFKLLEDVNSEKQSK